MLKIISTIFSSWQMNMRFSFTFYFYMSFICLFMWLFFFFSVCVWFLKSKIDESFLLEIFPSFRHIENLKTRIILFNEVINIHTGKVILLKCLILRLLNDNFVDAVALDVFIFFIITISVNECLRAINKLLVSRLCESVSSPN